MVSDDQLKESEYILPKIIMNGASTSTDDDDDSVEFLEESSKPVTKKVLENESSASLENGDENSDNPKCVSVENRDIQINESPKENGEKTPEKSEKPVSNGLDEHKENGREIRPSTSNSISLALAHTFNADNGMVVTLMDSTPDPTFSIPDREAFLDKFRSYTDRCRADNANSYGVCDLLKAFVAGEYRRSMPVSSTGRLAVNPETFRRQLAENNFVVPESVTIPPSMVVDLLVEYGSGKKLTDVIKDQQDPFDFRQSLESGDSPQHRQNFEKYPAANMTRFLYDIGYGLASESAYKGMLTKAAADAAKTLADAGKEALDVHGRVMERLRRVYDDARQQNEPLKLKSYRCPFDDCDFACETKLQMYDHQRRPHKRHNRWSCAFCKGDFSSWDEEEMEEHYVTEHGFTQSAKWELPLTRAQCSLCDEDFQYKSQVKTHMRICPMNVRNLKVTAGGGEAYEADVLNQYLWPKFKSVYNLDATPTPMVNAPKPTVQTMVAHKPMYRRILPLSVNTTRPTPTSLPTMPASLLPDFPMGGKPSPFVADIVDYVAGGRGKLNRLPTPFANIDIPSRASTSQQRPAKPIGTPQGFPKPNPGTAVPWKSKLQSTVQQIRNQMLTATRDKRLHTQHFCELCDAVIVYKIDYLQHLQNFHRKFLDKAETDLTDSPPLACSRCKERFYLYEGLERHLLLEHCLVTSELFTKAQRKEDGGRCRICARSFAFNLLHHLVSEHQKTLCSAEIVYSCDVCFFQCNSYIQLENHLARFHPPAKPAPETSKKPATPHLLSLQRDPHSSQNQMPTFVLNNQLYRVSTQQPQPPKLISVPAVPSYAESRKRPSDTKFPSPNNSPPKLFRATEEAPNVLAAHSRHKTDKSKKQLRYCCTPCGLKFISYDAVLKHWTERHLKSVRIPLCKIDECAVCKEKLTTCAGKHAASSSSAGLKLNFDVCESQKTSRRARTAISKTTSPPDSEVICLD